MASIDGVPLRLQLLGRVRAWRGAVELDFGGAGQRALVGLLALADGQPVSRAEITDLLWPDQPPRTATNVIHTRVKRLRGILDPERRPRGHSSLLLSVGASYALRLGRDAVDVERFRRLAAAARACWDEDRSTAAALLGECLDLWSGEPLADVPALASHPKAVALLAERRSVLVRYAEAMIAIGAAAEVLPALEEAAAAQPLDEATQASLIRAYQAAGQPARAIDAYHRTRRRLAEELGVDPSTELTLTHVAVLRATSPAAPSTADLPPGSGWGSRLAEPGWRRSPALARRRSVRRPVGGRPGAKPAAGAVVPRQLPPAAPHFGGRDREVAALAELTGLAGLAGLADERRGTGTSVIIAIAGTAGVGKTTLAVHWAHQVADRFPDGQLYLNLRGFGPQEEAMDPAVAIRRFLDALQVPPSRIPADPEAQAALYRSLLATRRMLIVLDNARDAAQVRPLVPAAPGCLVVIASRNLLSSLVAVEGAHPVMLDLFTTTAARQMLADRLGADRVAAEPEAADEIIESCARLPLALALVAARAVVHPDLPLTALARDLAGARGRLDSFADHDPHSDVRAVFSWSYRALTAPAARLFRMLSLHPGPDIAAPDAASLAGIALPEARALLAELSWTNLLTQRAPGRYTWHDLLRAYAADLAAGTDSELDCHAATGRIVDHYLRTAHAANRLLNPTADQPELAAPAGAVTPEQFTDYRHALDWFAAHHSHLLNVVDYAARAGWDAAVGPLAHAVTIFLDRQGHWHDAWAIWGTAARSAQRLGDQAAEAGARCQLGRACTRLYRFGEAAVHLGCALELAARAGDRTEQANVHHVLAILCERRGDLDQALYHDRQALQLYRDIDHPWGQAHALNGIGWHLTLLGDHEPALVYCQQALVLLEQLGARPGQADTWDSLGHAHHYLGHHGEAIEAYQHALDLNRDLGDRFGEAEALDRIGDVRRDTGDDAAARSSWRQALDILTELDHPSAEHIRAKLTAGDA